MYAALLSGLLAVAIVPAVVIVGYSRVWNPKRLYRHPELGIVAAFALDAARRIGFLAAGYPAPDPGPFWTTLTVLSLGFLAFVLWGRVIQIMRHHQRNADMRNRARILLAEYEKEK